MKVKVDGSVSVCLSFSDKSLEQLLNDGKGSVIFRNLKGNWSLLNLILSSGEGDEFPIFTYHDGGESNMSSYSLCISKKLVEEVPQGKYGYYEIICYDRTMMNEWPLRITVRN